MKVLCTSDYAGHSTHGLTALENACFLAKPFGLSRSRPSRAASRQLHDDSALFADNSASRPDGPTIAYKD